MDVKLIWNAADQVPARTGRGRGRGRRESEKYAQWWSGRARRPVRSRRARWRARRSWTRWESRRTRLSICIIILRNEKVGRIAYEPYGDNMSREGQDNKAVSATRSGRSELLYRWQPLLSTRPDESHCSRDESDNRFRRRSLSGIILKSLSHLGLQSYTATALRRHFITVF